VVLNKVRAEGEVEDRSRLDAVGIEIRPRMLGDEWRRKGIVRIGQA